MDTQSRKIVVMGVSGCGKSTVGEHLAAELGLEYKDGDELHPQSNIDKMASGQALDDDDRAWWLVQVGKWLRDRDSGVIACSALKRSYRDLIRTKAPAGEVEQAARAHKVRTMEEFLAGQDGGT